MDRVKSFVKDLLYVLGCMACFIVPALLLIWAFLAVINVLRQFSAIENVFYLWSD